MKRKIQKIAVIGSGVMGSRIACHFAHNGYETLLLDIAPTELTSEESELGLTLEHPQVRNRIVNQALKTTLKSNPSPIYSQKFANRIKTGNLEDNLAEISEVDWIIEAIIENPGIKKSLYEKIEVHRKPGSIISSNTSGIPLSILSEGRSDDFKSHFLGTHFFNPPRYLPLLEIIAAPTTDPKLMDFMQDFGSRMLGKEVIVCKDTPAFIANRIGVYSILAVLTRTVEHGLNFETVDGLTGPLLGRPKSATYRTCDVVGIDTLAHVAKGLYDNCLKDEKRDQFQIPDFVQSMIDKQLLGSKTKAGFYKKVKTPEGSQILSLDPESLSYIDQNKVRFSSVKKARELDLRKGIKLMFNADDQAGVFLRDCFCDLFSYAANRIPEIADDVASIDAAVRAGFGWKLGPFEYWDLLGAETILTLLLEKGYSIPQSIQDWIQKEGHFYRSTESGKAFMHASEGWKNPASRAIPTLEILSKTKKVFENKGVTATDLGDGIMNIEFHSKMNSMGGDVLGGINQAMDIAEEQFQGVTLYNEGDNFSAGANVGLIFMLAAEQEIDELELAVRTFQNTVMRMRYSSVPTVAAPHQMVLGGACELVMHCDKVLAHAELYMGLVEFGVGIIPAGAGTKEFALRLSDELNDTDIRLNRFRERFLTIGQAKVSTSAEEAFELGYLRKGVDYWIPSREHQLALAKKEALTLAERGYVTPIKRNDITVMGAEGLGIVYSGASSMQSAHYISEHDQLISEKLGEVLAGGNFNRPTQVSEDYLLALERKAFVELCTTRKTMERLQSIVKSGKILRN